MPTIAEKLAAKEPLNVLVTGACGQIAYNLIFLIIRGAMFGSSRVRLVLLDVPAVSEKLTAIGMEVEDCASDVLVGHVLTTDVREAFTHIDVALLVGARPRGPGMERKDLLAANAAIFREQGAALAAHSSPDVRVLVVGNPANTNALIACEATGGRVPSSHFTALTRLDENRARYALAARAGVHVSSVRDVFIWGNHSTTQYPDARFAHVHTDGRRLTDMIADDAWVRGEFVSTIQQRGKAVIDKRGASSAASAANAICDHVRDWILGSDGRAVSMGVYTDGTAYGVEKGLIFSMPCVCEGAGRFRIVTDLPVDDFSRAKLLATQEELMLERSLALSPPAPAPAV